jgi:hypothetical protein
VTGSETFLAGELRRGGRSPSTETGLWGLAGVQMRVSSAHILSGRNQSGPGAARWCLPAIIFHRGPHSFALIVTALHFVVLGLRSQAGFAAEDLFLLKQLTLYVEREVKPRRAANASRRRLPSRWSRRRVAQEAPRLIAGVGPTTIGNAPA